VAAFQGAWGDHPPWAMRQTPRLAAGAAQRAARRPHARRRSCAAHAAL